MNDKIPNYNVALAGNPNVGKSTIFNALTNMHQHTGNWSGKTVELARGSFTYKNSTFTITDLPGTYSLLSSSKEEEVARNFLCFEKYQAVVIVADGVCLERNLNLVLQILELTDRAILCVNLMDEAEKKGLCIDIELLSKMLEIPVIPTSAIKKKGLDRLIKEIDKISNIPPDSVHLRKKFLNWAASRLPEGDTELNEMIYKYLADSPEDMLVLENSVMHIVSGLSEDYISSSVYRDRIVNSIAARASDIYNQCVSFSLSDYNCRDRKLDKIFTSKITGYPIMLLMLCGVFWITIQGANYPSQWLSSLFSWLEVPLRSFFGAVNPSGSVTPLFMDGIYKTLTWVVSVMLPPMAIFFPLFALLEDSGYLPRVAFNLDKYFKGACAHGKQSLTMCMGLGCNACGVMGCRIIDSPRERMIAMLTNTFVPCNGRFPGIIALITMFMIGGASTGIVKSLWAALLLCGVILLGILITLLISRLLSLTVLKGLPSSFILELPPYRRPQFLQVIVRSILDRTLFVLGRAVVVAAPAGAIIWLLANCSVGDSSILALCTDWLDPFAKLIGLDGVILMAFILGWPANEIVIPIIIMTYMSTGSLTDYSSLIELKSLFINNGWTLSTAACTILFSLIHFPCATTCLTIKKECGSLKWTAAAFIIPTITGIALCFIVNQLLNLFI